MLTLDERHIGEQLAGFIEALDRGRLKRVAFVVALAADLVVARVRARADDGQPRGGA